VHGRQLGYSIAVKLKDQPPADQVALARKIVAEGTSTREVDVLLGSRPDEFLDEDFDGTGQSLEGAIETRLAGFRDELAERAAAADAAQTNSSPRRDPNRRNSPVQIRPEFFGTSNWPTPVDSKARRRLEELHASTWASSASEGALTVARDLVNWGQRSYAEATRLADECMAAFAHCPEEYVRLMHVVRLTADTGEQGLPHPLGIMLDLWVSRILRQDDACLEDRSAKQAS